jgi:hypothetical protein
MAFSQQHFGLADPYRAALICVSMTSEKGRSNA